MQVIGVRYDWSQKEQGMILSSFYVGYILTHIPGGLMAQRFGGKYVIGLGLSIAALLSMAIPVACQYGRNIKNIQILEHFMSSNADQVVSMH